MPNINFMSEANATAIFTAYATAIKLGLKAWIGTTAEWDQLTDAQKKQYQVNFKTDDCSGESIEAVKKSIADDFSINVNYDKGEYCYHLGDLYKFTSAHTAGAWSASDVEQVQVGDELSELKNTINNPFNIKSTSGYTGYQFVDVKADSSSEVSQTITLNKDSLVFGIVTGRGIHYVYFGYPTANKILMYPSTNRTATAMIFLKAGTQIKGVASYGSSDIASEVYVRAIPIEELYNPYS